MNYRKIYENFNNIKIPVGHHIHHIDGNHDNNDPLNLICLSKEDHWKEHYERGDMVALNGKFIQGASEAGKLGGRAGKGKIVSEGAREAIKAAQMERYKISPSPLKNRLLSDEHKIKISEAINGDKNPMFGKTHSDSTKLKISETKKEFYMNGGVNSMFGKTHSDSTKLKISETKKEFYMNGGKTPCAKTYNVFDKNENMILENVIKDDIIKKFSLSDREYTTILVYHNRTNFEKVHPKFNILIKKVNKNP